MCRRIVYSRNAPLRVSHVISWPNSCLILIGKYQDTTWVSWDHQYTDIVHHVLLSHQDSEIVKKRYPRYHVSSWFTVSVNWCPQSTQLAVWPDQHVAAVLRAMPSGVHSDNYPPTLNASWPTESTAGCYDMHVSLERRAFPKRNPIDPKRSSLPVARSSLPVPKFAWKWEFLQLAYRLNWKTSMRYSKSSITYA